MAANASPAASLWRPKDAAVPVWGNFAALIFCFFFIKKKKGEK
jgi:hypothetical protein